jgi:hypothetical protein
MCCLTTVVGIQYGDGRHLATLTETSAVPHFPLGNHLTGSRRTFVPVIAIPVFETRAIVVLETRVMLRSKRGPLVRSENERPQ